MSSPPIYVWNNKHYVLWDDLSEEERLALDEINPSGKTFTLPVKAESPFHNKRFLRAKEYLYWKSFWKSRNPLSYYGNCPEYYPRKSASATQEQKDQAFEREITRISNEIMRDADPKIVDFFRSKAKWGEEQW